MFKPLPVDDYQIEIANIITDLPIDPLNQNRTVLTPEAAHKIRETFINAHLEKGTLEKTTVKGLYYVKETARTKVSKQEYSLLVDAMLDLNEKYDEDMVEGSYQFENYIAETQKFSQSIVREWVNSHKVFVKRTYETRRKQPIWKNPQTYFGGYLATATAYLGTKLAIGFPSLDFSTIDAALVPVALGMMTLTGTASVVAFRKSIKKEQVEVSKEYEIDETLIKKYLTSQPEPKSVDDNDIDNDSSKQLTGD